MSTIQRITKESPGEQRQDSRTHLGPIGAMSTNKAAENNQRQRAPVIVHTLVLSQTASSKSLEPDERDSRRSIIMRVDGKSGVRVGAPPGGVVYLTPEFFE